MKDKRGQIGIIIFFSILLIIVIVGVIGAVVVSVLDYGSDQITPIMTDLGMVDEVNVSQAAEYTFGITDTAVQALPWLLALAYGMALVFSIIFVIGYSYNPHPVFIGFYIVLMILLVFGCIIMSNIYQDMYEGTNEMATRFQDQTMLSYLILFSPFIMVLISVIAGIFLFAKGGSREDIAV